MFIRTSRSMLYVPSFYILLLGLSIPAMATTGEFWFALPIVGAIFLVVAAMTRRIRRFGTEILINTPITLTLRRPAETFSFQVTTNGLGCRVALVTDKVDTLGWTMTQRNADRVVAQLTEVLRDLPRATASL